MFKELLTQKMISKKFDALVILGGGLKNENDKWRTTNFNEGDEFGIAGDRIRVIAGALLFSRGLSGLIYASCGPGQYKKHPEIPTVAEIMKKELIELGVNPDNIIAEKKSGNTHQQLKFVKSLIESQSMTLIGIISNEWHLPRIKAMLEYSPHLKGLADRVELLAGEEIAIRYDGGKWADVIDEARKSSGMKKRIALEQKGILDIERGRYQFS